MLPASATASVVMTTRDANGKREEGKARGAEKPGVAFILVASVFVKSNATRNSKKVKVASTPLPNVGFRS